MRLGVNFHDALAHLEEQQNTDTKVGEVLEHDVDGVVLRPHARFKCRKTSLHEQDQYCRNQQHQVIDRVLGQCRRYFFLRPRKARE